MKKELALLNNVLDQDFALRKKKNKSFSMRAYALFLGIDSSLLSKILRGSRDVSLDLFLSIKDKLIVEESLIEASLIKLEEENTVRSFRLKKAREGHTLLKQSHFEIIKDWKHYAFLELLNFSDFEESTEWMASKLGISPNEVNLLIERLVQSELLIIDKNGKWIDSTNGLSSHVLENGEVSKANKLYQETLIDLSKEALKNISIDKRDQSSIMMATSEARVRAAKPIIKEFRRKLCAFLEDTDQVDCLYQLGVSLFPLVIKEENEVQDAI